MEWFSDFVKISIIIALIVFAIIAVNERAWRRDALGLHLSSFLLVVVLGIVALFLVPRFIQVTATRVPDTRVVLKDILEPGVTYELVGSAADTSATESEQVLLVRRVEKDATGRTPFYALRTAGTEVPPKRFAIVDGKVTAVPLPVSVSPATQLPPIVVAPAPTLPAPAPAPVTPAFTPPAKKPPVSKPAAARPKPRNTIVYAGAGHNPNANMCRTK